MNQQQYKCGKIAIIGRPNVGKSSLLNGLMATKLAITTPRPQTTRVAIRGVLEDDTAQLVFFDTPGLHQPKNQLGSAMVKAASVAMQEADVILFLIDARFKPYIDETERLFLQQAKRLDTPVILVINKTDLAVKEQILPLISCYAESYDFAAIVPLSARKRDGFSPLIEEIKSCLPCGEPLFAEHDYTDQTERQLAAELIREQVLMQLREEVPYGVNVVIETFSSLDGSGNPCAEDEAAKFFIEAVLVCERKAHKGIIVGKQGSMIGKIGTEARRRIALRLEVPVELRLFVQVKEDWQNRASLLSDYGFRG